LYTHSAHTHSAQTKNTTNHKTTKGNQKSTNQSNNNKHIRIRQRADVSGDIQEDIDENFKIFDINEIEDLTASLFYKKILNI
jgi:hypothetical protein